MVTARAAPETIDAYIDGFPPAVQKILQQVRATVRKAAPDAAEAIRYRIPTFDLNGNLVHFAAFRNHIGFYPSSSGISEFSRALSRYEHAKGSVQFPLDEPMPLGLIAKIVKFRVAETRSRVSSNKTKVPTHRKKYPKRNHESIEPGSEKT